MPRYEYKCKGCTWHGLLWKAMNQRDDAHCPKCSRVVARNYGVMGLPNTQNPVVDNRFFNNGRGEYDPGLGEVIHSRKHRQEVMEAKGLHEVSKYDKDLFLKDREIVPQTTAEIKDQVEKAEGMVQSGEWKAGLPEKRVQEIENGKSQGSSE